MLILINLDCAAERRARMTRQLEAQDLPFARIGIDFRRLDRAAVAREVRERFPTLQFDARRLSGAEMGCWASHLTAWQRLAGSDAPAMCVIEDDLVLAPGFAQAVQTLLAVAQADARSDAERFDLAPFDLIYLGTSSRNLSQRRRTRIGGLAVHAPVGVIFNTWGYVVRRHWAQSFFSRGGRIDLPIDHFLGGRARWCRPEIGVLQPAVVSEDAQLGRASQIGPYTARLDRATLVDTVRRAVLASSLSDLYYRTVYKLL